MRRTGVTATVVAIVAAAVVGLGTLGHAAGTSAETVGTEHVQGAADIFLEIKGIRGG